MDEQFEITLSHNGTAYAFATRLVTVGYTHRFQVSINDIEVWFEPDEERNYRAILKEPSKGPVSEKDSGLIKAVADKIASIHSEE